MTPEDIKNLWLWKCGYAEKSTGDAKYEDLLRTEWSDEFEMFMRRRLVMGAMRYGRLNHGKKSRKNRIKSAIDRLKLYLDTGNQEHLVDAANLCMCEFIEPNKDRVRFTSIDDGIHVE